MNATIESLPRALAAASPRLPRRLELYSEMAPVVLIGMDRGHELLDFRPPASLHLIVLFGRAAVASPLSRIKLNRFDELMLSSDIAWTVRALESCDLLLIECDIAGTKRKDKIAEFLPCARRRFQRIPESIASSDMRMLPARAMAVMA